MLPWGVDGEIDGHRAELPVTVSETRSTRRVLRADRPSTTWRAASVGTATIVRAHLVRRFYLCSTYPTQRLLVVIAICELRMFWSQSNRYVVQAMPSAPRRSSPLRAEEVQVPVPAMLSRSANPRQEQPGYLCDQVLHRSSPERGHRRRPRTVLGNRRRWGSSMFQCAS